MKRARRCSPASRWSSKTSACCPCRPQVRLLPLVAVTPHTPHTKLQQRRLPGGRAAADRLSSGAQGRQPAVRLALRRGFFSMSATAVRSRCRFIRACNSGLKEARVVRHMGLPSVLESCQPKQARPPPPAASQRHLSGLLFEVNVLHDAQASVHLPCGRAARARARRWRCGAVAACSKSCRCRKLCTEAAWSDAQRLRSRLRVSCPWRWASWIL